MSDSFDLGFTKKDQTRDFQLKEFIFRYLRYWPFLVAFIASAFTIGFIRIRYATPIYSVTGSLFINKENGNNRRADDLQNIFLFQDNVNLKNELEILKSKPLLKRVVLNLGLQTNYFNKGNVRSTNIYGASPLLLEIISLKDSTSSFSLNLEAGEGDFKLLNTNIIIPYNSIFQTSYGAFKINKLPGRQLANFNSDNYVIKYMPLAEAASDLASKITTTQTIDQATILDIRVETDNIVLGKDIVNDLMKEYGKMNVEQKKEISQLTMQFIDERLDTIKEELGLVETGLLHFRERNNVIDLTAQSEQYYSNYSDADKGLISQQVQIGIVNFLIKYIEEPSNKYKIVPTDLGVQDPTVIPLLTQYNALQLERGTLIQSTGPANPKLIMLTSSIEKLREQIHEALKNVKRGYEIASAKTREQLSLYERNIKSIPSKSKGLLDIERQQKIKQDLYLFLLQKREEAAISAAATIPSSNPLEDASPSYVPVKPNKRNIYLIALLAGILIPVGFIAIMEMLNDKVREREEVVKNTHAPVIGEIGHAGNDTLIVRSGSRTVVAEQFRIMRTNLQYLITKTSNPVILVTSSVSGEGKSFVATNYGAAVALAGKKTIILEFDIRKPRLLKGLNIEASKGLSNYMIGSVKNIEELILPVPEVNNLYVIGCGPIPPNPSELLLEPNVKKLFDELKSRFDCIIVDTAPIGLVSDALTLSAFANASAFIVRHAYTLKRQLHMIEDLYQQKRLPNMGLVINDIQTQGRYKGYYGYGGGSYYGYGYSYGGDYFQKENRSPKKRARKNREK